MTTPAATRSEPGADNRALGPERAYGLAPGSLLDVFNAAGVVSAGDIHVALVLGRLAGGASEEVQLGVALAARAPRMGHVLVDLGDVRLTVVPSVAPEGGTEADLASLPWPEPEAWVRQLAASGLCSLGEPGAGCATEQAGSVTDQAGPRPLRLVGQCLYLDRYWRDETVVAGEVVARAGHAWRPAGGAGHPGGPFADDQFVDEAVQRLFPADPGGAQAQAAVRALRSTFSVISGGPGTGKTTTVARFLALVHEEALVRERPRALKPQALTRGPGSGPLPDGGRTALPSVALAAPTGKAAARMAEAVHNEAARADVTAEVRAALLGLEASTVHRLLGRRPGRQDRFRHDRENRLPHDVVVVDETSMMSLPLMARLLEAVRPEARLVLVGDHEQLASVEAGAVLADLVGPVARGEQPPSGSGLAEGITVLKDNHRFTGPLADLAGHVRAGRSQEAVAMLSATTSAGAVPALRWLATAGTPPLAELRATVMAGAIPLLEAGRSGDAEQGLAMLERWRLLCAHRDGPAGASTWNDQVEQWLARDGAGVVRGGWYPGRPVVMTENDYSLGLFNGDSGVTIARPGGGLSVAFRRGRGVETVSPARLGGAQTAYAMTAHRAQGSEFDRVCVLLPEVPARVLTRELVYTALTRARLGVVLVATEAALVSAIERPVARASRLTERTWGRSRRARVPRDYGAR